MKIAFYSGKLGQKQTSRIIDILKSRAPNHQYNHYVEQRDADVVHCVAPHDSLDLLSRASRSVISLLDMRFLTSPDHFSLVERLFRLPLYRYHCRHAARIIAKNSLAKTKAVEALSIDEGMVEVCLPLQLLHLGEFDLATTQEEMQAVRAKFELPDTYILIAGEIDTMHDHAVILHAIFSLPQKLNVVIYGRRTTHSDVLLRMTRDVGQAARVQFIYEIEPADLRSLYRMALVLVYMPAFESSILPIIDALHQRVPMILSDTPLNREAAGSAAEFVPSHDQEAIAEALKRMIYNESYRGQLLAQSCLEAQRYSQESLTKQLFKIYESL
ncbi:MAG: glycosyltransferase [Rikenellaceae bacterium]